MRRVNGGADWLNLMQIKNSILIKEKPEVVFSVMADVERWPEFLASHKKMKVINKEGDRILIEWNWKHKLRSMIAVDKDRRRITTHQLSGPVKGLVANYEFEEVLEGTKMSLSQHFNSEIPVLGKAIEWAVGSIVKRMGRNTLRRIKERVGG